jgi:hypothetical protein
MSTQMVGCDTAWLLIATALVMLMMPGLALFYGGLVRTKNVLSTFMHTFVALAVVSLLWVTLGYSLAFGEDHGGVIGGFDHLFFNGFGLLVWLFLLPGYRPLVGKAEHGSADFRRGESAHHRILGLADRFGQRGQTFPLELGDRLQGNASEAAEPAGVLRFQRLARDDLIRKPRDQRCFRATAHPRQQPKSQLMLTDSLPEEGQGEGGNAPEHDLGKSETRSLRAQDDVTSSG